MTQQQILELAISEGFYAAMISPDQIPVDAKFRAFCEQNLCGRYGANYSCPPDCGSPDEMHKAILAQEQILVVETIWDIESYQDKETVQRAKASHNAAALRLMDRLKQAGFGGFCSGYNGCPLCDPCKRICCEPCAFPETRISCLSAYCVDVAELASRCGLEFAWKKGKLFLFGMLALHHI